MVFEQKILKEEKIKCILSILCVLLPVLAIGVWMIVNEDAIKAFLSFFLVCYLPLFLLMLFLALNQLEWYYLYNDRIEARGILGIKNKVYYGDVLFVEEMEIPLTSRGTHKAFFVFHDGRKNNGNIHDHNSCYNRKKYNFRIYKTPELEAYIVNGLRFEVKRS